MNDVNKRRATTGASDGAERRSDASGVARRQPIEISAVGRELDVIIKDMIEHPFSIAHLPRGLLLEFIKDEATITFRCWRKGVHPSEVELETVNKFAFKAGLDLPIHTHTFGQNGGMYFAKWIVSRSRAIKGEQLRLID